MRHSEKLVLFDVDGVVVLPGTRDAPSAQRWNAQLQTDLGIDPDWLSAHLFAPAADEVPSPFERCALGQADIVPTLQSILAEIGQAADVEALLAYWFERDAYVDPQVLAAVGALRAHGYRCCLATSQEKRRAHHLWETLALRESFDQMYCTADLSLSKKQPEFFRAVSAAERCADPLYFDDRLDVVRCAAVAGWRAVHYTSVASVRDHPDLVDCFAAA